MSESVALAPESIALLFRRLLPYKPPSWADQRRLARLHRTQNRKPRGLRRHLRRQKQAARG